LVAAQQLQVSILELVVCPQVDLDDPSRVVVLDRLVARLDQPLIRVAHHDIAADFRHPFDRASWLGPRRGDIPEADDAVDSPPVDVAQHGIQGNQVAVDVRDQRGSHRGLVTVSGWMRPPEPASRPPSRWLRTARTSARIETAVSAGVTAPMSRPSGPEMRSISDSL